MRILLSLYVRNVMKVQDGSENLHFHLSNRINIEYLFEKGNRKSCKRII